MYTSDNALHFAKNDQGEGAARDRRAVRAYLVASVVCAVASFVYLQFSHDVVSVFMAGLFAIPLVLGAGAYALFGAMHVHPFSRVAFNAYNSGVAALGAASMLQGIFEIAGTGSHYVSWLVLAGVVFIGFALVCAFRGRAGSR